MSWRRSSLAAFTVLALIVLVQFAIPAGRLGTSGDTAERFGWQMFSVSRVAPQFVVETGDGETEIDLGDYMARVRADVDLVAILPTHLCAVIADARRVTWEGGEHTC